MYGPKIIPTCAKVMKFSGKQPKSFTRLVETIGVDAALSLIVSFGGGMLYIPKINRFMRSRRNHKIWEDHCSSKYTIKQMETKWKMKSTSIYTIVRRYKEDLLEIANDESITNG